MTTAKFPSSYRGLNQFKGCVETEVWYMQPGSRRDFCGGIELAPWSSRPEDTHTLLGRINTNGRDDMEALYTALQGDNWSPNGEARELIASIGLVHTSMSVGDLFCFQDKDTPRRCFMVEPCGFREVPLKN